MTVLPALRSPLEGDSVTEFSVGPDGGLTAVTEMLSKFHCEGFCSAANSRVEVLPVAVTVKLYSV